MALTYASDQQFFDSDHMNREAVWLPAQPLWLFPPQLWGKETISLARCIEKPSVAMFALK